MTPVVRPARPGERAGLIAVLVRAFDDDPVVRTIFTTPGRRRRGLAAFFGAQLDDLLPFGWVQTTEDRDGVALWAPPGKRLFGGGARALPRLLPVLPHVVGRTLSTVSHLSHLEGLQPEEPVWYLATLGTEPERQGRGVGSALLAPALHRADTQGLPCYLESSKERNLSFYGRHGFEVVQEVAGHGFPPIWAMRRQPRPPED